MQQRETNSTEPNQNATKDHTHGSDNKSKDIMIITQTGTTEQLDELEALLKKYGIIEMVRSGKLVMAKGREAT